MLGCIVMALMFTACSGEDGEDGDIGPQGSQGPQGDSIKGDQGEQGDPGEDKPNVDFYFQNGFKGYNGTKDAIIDNYTGSGSNSILSRVYFTPDNSETEYTVMRFDDISDEITNTLIDAGQNCEGSFYVNKAILYLYMSNYNSDADRLFMHVGFYGENDPLFVESEASWDDALNGQGWSGGKGGESNEWSGPFPGTDDFSLLLSGGPGLSGSDHGWFPIIITKKRNRKLGL